MKQSPQVVLLAAVLAAALLAAAVPARAHSVEYRVVPGHAHVVEVFTADGRPFSYESYEITGPGDSSPFQIGRTDRLGRVVFAPDRIGEWSIRVWSEDGHGLTVNVPVADIAAAAVPAVEAIGRRRLIGTVAGIILILALGAVLYFQKQRGQR